ncbi:CHC2 zinc finger domain-containing protein [Pseudomonas syringae]|uniref:CHC2 zinc finger domain-containing protein n=1 Tax=Pseudomonas syringae TaxID=317 RepID=UPI003204F803
MPRINIEKLLHEVEIDKVAERLGMELRNESATRKLALCPFHSDKTPSLLIDTSRAKSPQHFHCFACGEHGDAIDLVRGVLNLDFKGAVEWLSPSYSSTSIRNRGERKDLKVDQSETPGLELAYKLYKASNDKERLATWASSRSLDLAALEKAGFLYAHKNSLSKQVSVKKPAGTQRELAGALEEASLIRKLLPSVGTTNYHLNLQSSQDIRYADFFTGDRIVFPIRDEQKKLLGLAGRALDDQTPKYLFSKNFPKSKALFRIEQATSSIRASAKEGKKDLRLYVCEGFLDALKLEGIGLPAIAVMGISLSKEQVQIIKGISDSLLSKVASLTICICFDRDEAGLRGASETALKLLSANLDVLFIWPTASQIKRVGGSTRTKDPDEYLSGLSAQNALLLLKDSTYESGIAVLANQFGVDADDLLEAPSWNNASRSRKYRAFEKARTELRKVVGNTPEKIKKLIEGNQEGTSVAAMEEWLQFLNVDVATEAAVSECYLTNSDARLNHARLLAYMGSRRGELPCDESKWERLDVAASAFNILLHERLSNELSEPIGPFEAVWVPRSFGSDEPRLKVMPQPEDLIIHQYVLNELLTERWDASALGGTNFSHCIPAVRYYREERKTVTTGLSDMTNDLKPLVLSDQTLSFAYQIDMEVIEGRQPATDQGMFRPFLDCWREFMQSLNKQAKEIKYVYAIRLDVSRYYDRIRRHVVRDSIQPHIERALESVAGNAPAFAELLKAQAGMGQAADKTASVVEQLCDMVFGYPYLRPDNGRVNLSDPLRGIPQGPVISAWLGSVALFPVDLAALELMKKYNVDGETHLGYARYVDDIILLASSAEMLEELREVVDLKTRNLDLALLAKADAIPPMTAEQFSDYANQGRALEASGPAWEPPLAGDGETGWEFWSGAPPSDRQSALQLLSNWEIYKSSAAVILQTVKTSFLAMDLRSSELAKGARLLWYVVASKLSIVDSEPGVIAEKAWRLYEQYWKECTEGAGWSLDSESFGWEAPSLFALEGLEKLIDHKNSLQLGLSASENALRQKRISYLAKVVLEEGFRQSVLTNDSKLKYQIEKRLDLLEWKAAKSCGVPVRRTKYYAERSMYIRSWLPFDWFHAAVEELMLASQCSDADPLSSYVTQYKSLERSVRAENIESYNFFRYFLPSDGNEDDLKFFAEPDSKYLGLTVQVLVALVPRECIFSLLSKRICLLSSVGAGGKLIIMPPLPGVNQRRMVACKVDDGSTENLRNVSSFEVYDVFSKQDIESNLIFFGAENGAVIFAVPDWAVEESPSSALVRKASDLPVGMSLLLLDKPSSGKLVKNASGLKQAASLYRSLVLMMAEYERQNDGFELIPAWPYIAVNTTGEASYLICEGVPKGEVGNRAFVRDGGRALRTVEVPIYEAQLWRAGVALSDYLGFHDDIAKFSSSESEVPLDETTLEEPSHYVLRSQLRKLRGAFANSQVGRRITLHSFLPASVERALELLENFPDSTDNPLLQLMHLLATETETAGMRVRYEKHVELTELTVFLRSVADRVLSKLPLSIGKVLAKAPAETNDLRRDLVGILTFTRSLWSMEQNAEISPLFAWRTLRAGAVSSGIAVALQGILASLRSHGGFARYEGFDFPVEWEIPPANVAVADPERTDTNIDENISLLDLLRLLVMHLGYRMRLADNGNPQISPNISNAIEKIALALASLGITDLNKPEPTDWPFFDVTEKALEVLSIDLLESVCNMVKDLDSELGLKVVLVMQQAYGFNAQTKRFTDSRGLAWDIRAWMISQYPLRARHVEESFDADRRVVRVWTEVYDKNSDRLLSISVLGEPFASIALLKTPVNPSEIDNVVTQGSSEESIPVAEIGQGSPLAADGTEPQKDAFPGERENVALHAQSIDDTLPDFDEQGKGEGSPVEVLLSDATIKARANSFKLSQKVAWSNRKASRNLGHVRVAFVQWDHQELSYAHPMVEATPKKWPFSAGCKSTVIKKLKYLKNSPYGSLLSATDSTGLNHLWKEKKIFLPSWVEHRRRRLLLSVVDACESFGVDLLVLPEYSVRPETVRWLKEECLPGKTVAVLAGTYLEFDSESVFPAKSATLNLLWPVPENIREYLKPSGTRGALDVNSANDEVSKGIVLNWSRPKKYRSVALNEFIRPGTKLLAPLFVPGQIIDKLRRLDWDISIEGAVQLLAYSGLPLANFMELICSEIFLFTSPTNIPEMARDYAAICSRFGLKVDEEDVWEDLKGLSNWLSVCSKNGEIGSRRSILIVPAATTRTADYWIAGQAGLLAAGTTTVFINGVGSGLKGGSCFIGRESWKNGGGTHGYIETLTPYHGWSKGIYYNSKEDPLSDGDQALVIADIDPHNMLEGKPRPQMLPVPLQLVAYLPIAETVDEKTLDRRLCAAIPSNGELSDPGNVVRELSGKLRSRSLFWHTIAQGINEIDIKFFEGFSKNFSDERTLQERAKSFFNNGYQQPFSSVEKQDLLSSPAFYDWIDADMTLREGEELPYISVPSWIEE